MSKASDIHPLAPDVETPQEALENTTQAVKVRGAVEIGAMRWVLGIGIALAVLAFAAAYLLGYLPYR
ncbi:hypothetical protein [Sandaracinobacteroides hominis]|uniref:hypothetical protein n=1 Tax=Sandaracinobacteroides hominis TaxID=2780086 RepID=UPI0018F37743|nr:hypothetical protein [Sandaracinobacteroides hominis]